VAEPLPAALRAAVLLIAVETVAVCAIVVLLVYLDVTGTAESLPGSIALTVLAAAFAATLGALARALYRRRGGARGLTIALQLMLLPVGYYSTQGGLAWFGVPVVVVALLVCGLLITPASTKALGLAERGTSR
jgi:hypothetical protein